MPEGQEASALMALLELTKELHNQVCALSREARDLRTALSIEQASKGDEEIRCRMFAYLSHAGGAFVTAPLEGAARDAVDTEVRSVSERLEIVAKTSCGSCRQHFDELLRYRSPDGVTVFLCRGCGRMAPNGWVLY